MQHFENVLQWRDAAELQGFKITIYEEGESCYWTAYKDLRIVGDFEDYTDEHEGILCSSPEEYNKCVFGF